MARPLRIEFPNACYHVSNKAEGRLRLFPSDQYYMAFLDGLQQAASRFNVELISWCLLSSEYHLLIKTPEANLCRFMRQVDGLYTQHYQRIRGRKGSVFRARYKSVLIQAEKYLARVSRVIHNLPRQVRQDPLAWPWSSFAAYVNNTDKDSGICVDAVLDEFGKTMTGRKAYASFVSVNSDVELARFYGMKNQPSVLGDDKFRERVKSIISVSSARGKEKTFNIRKRPSAQKIISSVADIFKVSDSSIVKAARGPGSKNVPRWVAMYLCQEAGGITLQKIARQFGLQRYGTVSTTIGKLKEEFSGNPPLESRVENIRLQLGK